MIEDWTFRDYKSYKFENINPNYEYLVIRRSMFSKNNTNAIIWNVGFLRLISFRKQTLILKYQDEALSKKLYVFDSSPNQFALTSLQLGENCTFPNWCTTFRKGTEEFRE